MFCDSFFFLEGDVGGLPGSVDFEYDFVDVAIGEELSANVDFLCVKGDISDYDFVSSVCEGAFCVVEACFVLLIGTVQKFHSSVFVIDGWEVKSDKHEFLLVFNVGSYDSYLFWDGVFDFSSFFQSSLDFCFLSLYKEFVSGVVLDISPAAGFVVEI